MGAEAIFLVFRVHFLLHKKENIRILHWPCNHYYLCWLLELQTLLIVCADFIPISNAAASPSAAERFSSPAAGTGAKRRLFDSGEGTSSNNSSSRSSAIEGGSQAVPIPMVLVSDKTGRQVSFITSVRCVVHFFSVYSLVITGRLPEGQLPVLFLLTS